MDENDERLDKALSEYLGDKHATSEEILPYYKSLERLEVLRDVPERDSEVQAMARKEFLEQAESMLTSVPKDQKLRLRGWKTFFKRERSPMTTILGFLLALVIAFGGVGSTAYAAQDSLPTEPLYPVKQLIEQIRLALTTNTENEVHLLLDLTEERVGEMIALANQGLEVPEQTQLRLEQHLQQAFAETARLGDPELINALERLQNMAQNQIQTLERVQQNAPEEASEGLELTIGVMDRARQAAEDGLVDPATLPSYPVQQGPNRPEDALPEGDARPVDSPQQPDNTPPDLGDTQPGTPGDGQGHDDSEYGNGNDNAAQCDCECECETCDCTCDCTSQLPENITHDSNDKGGKD